MKLFVFAAAVLVATPACAQVPWMTFPKPNEAVELQKRADTTKALHGSWQRGGGEQLNRTEPRAADDVIVDNSRRFQTLLIEHAKNRCRSALTPRNERCKDI